MAVVKHNQLDALLNGTEALPRYFLICGEPFLVDQAFDRLSHHLLAGVSRQLSLDLLDGRTTPMGEIVEQTATFSFFNAKKVIAVRDAPLFTGKTAGTEVVYDQRDLDQLASLMDKGIPDNHTLVMTTGQPDKRKKVYKQIQKNAVVVDCTVPTGARKADQDEQQAVLRELARQTLAGTGKRMDNPAFQALLDQTGFNPGLFAKNLEKLLAYTGARTLITAEDVRAVVHRDKKDPVFSLTNAVMDRNPQTAMAILTSLFTEGFHPLQILKSLENQVRKLLMIKAFTVALYRENQGMPPLKSMHFNGFKQTLLPRIVARDQAVAEQEKTVQHWLTQKNTTSGKGLGPDLLLAPNPKNAYPVFQNFLKSENFSLDELISAMAALSDLDFDLKTSGTAPRTGIENFILAVCRKGGFPHA